MKSLIEQNAARSVERFYNLDGLPSSRAIRAQNVWLQDEWHQYILYRFTYHR